MKSLTFLHAADLHLDSPFVGLQSLPEAILHRLKESTFKSLHKIIDLAIDKKVDFVIFAGDLYDQEDRSVKAQSQLRKEMERLQKVGTQVFIIHGNHDHTGGNWLKLEWPENVHFFSDKEVEVKRFEKDGYILASLYGFSFGQRAVTEKMVHHYQKSNTGLFHIGLLHGNLEGGQGHNQYAPFKLSELIDKGFDYWALGHIHKRQVLNEQPLIIYPGNIQGRNKKETGEKGCYIVTLTEANATHTFYPTSDIVWETVQISIDQVLTIDALLSQCLKVITNLRKSDQGLFLTITLIGTGILNELLDNIVLEDLLNIINEEESQNNNFVWVTSIVNETSHSYNRDELKSESTFIGELLTIIDEYDQYEQAILPISEHPQARKYVEKFTREELEEITKEAENILIHELLKDE